LPGGSQRQGVSPGIGRLFSRAKPHCLGIYDDDTLACAGLIKQMPGRDLSDDYYEKIFLFQEGFCSAMVEVEQWKALR